MDRRIYVLGRNVAVTEDDRLVEYIQCDAEGAAAETVLLGRVVRVVQGMQAAFVDIGQEKNGFLPLQENSKTFDGQPVREGDRVLVQIKKDAHGTKGAFLSRDISLVGQLVLLMPMNRYIGVSSRVTGDGMRSAMKDFGADLAAGRFGLVLREAAQDASEEDIRQEAEALFILWHEISRAAAVVHAPSVVHQPRTVLQAVLDDDLPRGVLQLVTDGELPEVSALPVRRVEPESDEVRRIRHQLDQAFHRRVWLDSGANLVIDPCEAMTVIDVNTAKFTGKARLEDTILRTNLEAAAEIARQVRLRNLSGMILIDMIDMKEEAEREAVLAALREAFSFDRIKTVVHGFTSLGLIEMTRKKSRVTLQEAMTEPCPHCGGSGLKRREENHG